MASMITDQSEVGAGTLSSQNRIQAHNARTETQDVRLDIQALRAFAVMSVIVFHFWPNILPGGFIGVDVFFVISGYLITLHLIRSVESTGRIELAKFWSRRARRLLPASFLVLLVSAAITFMFLDAQDRYVHLRSIFGSALYIENWLLAFDSVDYLAAENNPSIAQHYWSLGVEEQFYLFWPVMLGFCAYQLRHYTNKIEIIKLITIGVFICSLSLCIIVTDIKQPFGFFSSPTRMWEFAAGAYIAFSRPGRRISGVWRMVAAGSWCGLAICAVMYGNLPFPGWTAIAPVLCAALVIAAGTFDTKLASSPHVASNGVQWIGDNSYALYLWHWPLVIFLPAVLERPPYWFEFLPALGLCFILARLTKSYIEDPIRFNSPWITLSPFKVAVAAGLASLILATIAVLPVRFAKYQAEQKQEQFLLALDKPGNCLGANWYLDPVCQNRAAKWSADELIPNVDQILGDTQKAYKCYQKAPAAPLQKCRFGSPGGKKIAVTGDSHAAMLLVPLRRLAEKRNWEVYPFVGRGCIWSDEPSDPQCGSYWTALAEELESGRYDLIIVTSRDAPSLSPNERNSRVKWRAAAWQKAIANGTPVLAIADNPFVSQQTLSCLSRHSVFTDSTCVTSPPATWGMDLNATAAMVSGSGLADFGEAYCNGLTCPLVLGGVVAYRDQHHITASFAQTLAPYLGTAIEEHLRRPGEKVP